MKSPGSCRRWMCHPDELVVSQLWNQEVLLLFRERDSDEESLCVLLLWTVCGSPTCWAGSCCGGPRHGFERANKARAEESSSLDRWGRLPVRGVEIAGGFSAVSDVGSRGLPSFGWAWLPDGWEEGELWGGGDEKCELISCWLSGVPFECCVIMTEIDLLHCCYNLHHIQVELEERMGGILATEVRILWRWSELSRRSCHDTCSQSHRIQATGSWGRTWLEMTMQLESLVERLK